jgi:SAM-dependent methyltransferase
MPWPSSFDARAGGWASVAAQRRSRAAHPAANVPAWSRLLELAGGTAEDALFLAARGRHVLFTDGSAAMVALARRKAVAAGLADNVLAERLMLEQIGEFALPHEWPTPLAGAYSNFAGLNCVADLRPVARGLARLLPAGAAALLVMFGPCPPGDACAAGAGRALPGGARAADARLGD